MRRTTTSPTPLPAAWRNALGELTVVVVGILIAFALNAWWAGRTEEGKVREGLIAIERDFQANRSEFDHVVTESGAYVEDVVQLTALKAEALPDLPAERAERLVFQLQRGGLTFDPQLGAVQAFLASERLDRVRDERLRGAIAAWPGIMDELAEDQAIMIDMYMAQQERAVQLGIYALTLQRQVAGARPETAAAILRLVVDDAEMLNRLSAHAFAIDSLLEELVEVGERIDEVLSRLEQEIPLH